MSIAQNHLIQPVFARAFDISAPVQNHSQLVLLKSDFKVIDLRGKEAFVESASYSETAASQALSTKHKLKTQFQVFSKDQINLNCISQNLFRLNSLTFTINKLAVLQQKKTNNLILDIPLESKTHKSTINNE